MCDKKQLTFLFKKLDSDSILEATSFLEKREKIIINERFFQNKTLREVGIPLGIKKERVRQIENSCLRRMESYIMNKY